MKHRVVRRFWWQRHPVLASLFALLVIVFGTVGGTIITVIQTPLGAAVMQSHLSLTMTAPVTSAKPVWPAVGEAAFVVPSLNAAGNSPAQSSVPIGSVTKLMTAYVVLKDYPLSMGQQGPSYTVTPLDVLATAADVVNGDAVSAVTAGQVLTEYQLLEGLLIHSSCNYADMLAQFDAGSVSAFVSKMNLQSPGLKMTSTHYADASGVSPASVSTPYDQLILAPLLMQNPVFAQIVSETTVTIPVSGTQSTFQPLLGTQGVVGVKSGFTSQADGCDVMAVNEVIAGQAIQILTVVTGQKGRNNLVAAGEAALGLATSVKAMVDVIPISDPSTAVATIGWSLSKVNLVVSPGLQLPAWPGQKVTVSLAQVVRVTGSLSKNTVVANLSASNLTFHVHGSAVTQKELHEPTLLQRVV